MTIPAKCKRCREVPEGLVGTNRTENHSFRKRRRPNKVATESRHTPCSEYHHIRRSKNLLTIRKTCIKILIQADFMETL